MKWAAPEEDPLEGDASSIGPFHNAIHVALPIPGGGIAHLAPEACQLLKLQFLHIAVTDCCHATTTTEFLLAVTYLCARCCE